MNTNTKVFCFSQIEIDDKNSNNIYDNDRDISYTKMSYLKVKCDIHTKVKVMYLMNTQHTWCEGVQQEYQPRISSHIEPLN